MSTDQEGPMTDERLQHLIDEAAPTYRLPKDPPLDAMWDRIEREHFDATAVLAPAATRTKVVPLRGAMGMRRWLAPLAGIAATLLVGIGIGRFTAQPASEVPMVANATDLDSLGVPTAVDPLKRTTSEYLDEAAQLLVSLPRDVNSVDASFVADARQMLTRTRLLLDSPMAAEPRMRDMLEDLELLLAQVVRLRAAPRAEELTFIADAMDERDMVPRLRTVAAALSYSDY